MKNSFFYLLVIFAFHFWYLFCVSDDLSGFINIDCGSAKSSIYKGLQYSTDAGFIDSGENHDVTATDVPLQIQNLRSFPVGKRNCYNLSVTTGSKGNKYIIRAHFLYGNYDGKNVVPRFDLYLGVEKWDTITTAKSGEYLWTEIIHVPISNNVYVCLVNTGQGIPYISALELRSMNATAYSQDPQDSLKNVQRSYFAPGSSNQIIRYPDDIYDRRWSPFPTPTNWIEIKTTSTIQLSNDNGINVPSAVLQSAVTTKDNNSNLNLNWNGVDNNTRFFSCIYFSEVERHDQAREFDLYLNGKLSKSVELTQYLNGIFLCYAETVNIQMNFTFTLQKSVGSAYPPIMSAVERFAVTQFLQAPTDENDGSRRYVLEDAVCKKSDYVKPKKDKFD